MSVKALLKKNAAGVLVLPLSSSPEIHDNRLQAFLEPNTNYDLACMKMLFLALAEMAADLGKEDEAGEWHATAKALGPWHISPENKLMLDSREELRESHRHLSNLMGLYPFNLTTIEGTPRDRQIIRASLEQWEKLGTAQWCGYSFSWMSALRARVGDSEEALKNLEIFVKAFILRNGFHVNGDQTKSGYSSMTYRPFTLEGNMLAAAAVHEMLLQSWSPAPGTPNSEVIRIFPAVSAKWKDASFNTLRAEGGHIVSARRENGSTSWFQITSGRSGVVRVLDNFGVNRPRWDTRKIRKNGSVYEITVKKGEVVEAICKPSR